MLNFLTWYLVLTLFGLATLPLGWTWFRALPDRGWGLLRPLGLLLAGFVVWFAGSLGLLRLEAATVAGALALLAALGGWALERWGGGWRALWAWLKARWDIVLVHELLFLVALAFWTWYRIHDAEGIQYTERPMDFALYRAILRGGEIPPGDPWMSGFAISYYYLGYLLMAMVTALSGVAAAVGYHLAVATLAALTSGAAFTVALGTLWERVRPRVAVPLAMLAVLLVLGISNLTGIANTAYYRGHWPDEWFARLGVNDLSLDEAGQRRQSGWWWWASSRTLSDYGPDGRRIEIIDEFPFFSFMLGDMHPHVMALPFAALSIGIALNALRASRGAAPLTRRWRGEEGPEALAPPDSWGVGRGFGALTLVLTALVLGGMGMLNTWDFPTQVALHGAVWLIALAPTLRREGRRWLPPLAAGFGAMVALALLAYLPFYLSFRSQADGIRLSQWATSPTHYLLMFGLFILVAAPFVAARRFSRKKGDKGTEDSAQSFEAQAKLFLSIVGVMLGTSFPTLWLMERFEPDDPRLALLVAALWVGSPLVVMRVMKERSVGAFFLLLSFATTALSGAPLRSFTLLWVGLLMWGAVAAMLRHLGDPFLMMVKEREPEGADPDWREAQWDQLFPLLLIALAALITMGPELFYIKDFFAGRMNTVFKLYYQGWLLFALATPFALAWLAQRWRAWSLLVIVPFALLLAGSLWYPITALQTKTNNFAEANWDGRFWMQRFDPDRFAAVEWLDRQRGTLVVVEAPGQSYIANTSALSAYTGHSTLLGWTGHESQWRGDSAEIVAREPVIQSLYTNPDPAAVLATMDEYDIDIIAVTNNERDKYQLTDAQIARFRDFLTPLFEQGSVVLFGR